MATFYMTDVVKTLNNNVVNLTGGSLVTMRMAELLGIGVETRTPQEIITHIAQGLDELGDE